MRKTVKIGSNDVELVANAASPYLYRQVFKEDFLRKLQEKDPDTDLMQKMCFVMMKQAEGADIGALGYGDYLAWLEGYEPMDILLASEDIMSVYFKQAKGTAVPKPKGD